MQFTSNVGAGYQGRQQQQQQVDTPMCSCGAPFIHRVSNSDNNPGRAFWACSGKPYCRGWHGWVDEGAPKQSNSGGSQYSAQKRPRQNDDQVMTRLAHLEQQMTEVLAQLGKKARIGEEVE